MTPGDSLPAGTVIDDRYRIEGVLGSGGMGSVYRGVHVSLRRPVAVKVLRGDAGADSEWTRRFQREAFATARLDHPNCIGVIDCGALGDGRPYIVMPMVRGVSLFDELEQRERLEPARALRILRHVLRGLGHAHELGMVHRDVKPGNIMLSPQQSDPDFARLLDFGVVKLLGATSEQEGGQKLTHAGCAIGSPTYMSPEQVTGGAIDGRSDLYSATVVLFEMITGRPPFVSDDAYSIVRMHLHTPPPQLSEVSLELNPPSGLAELIRDGLAKQVDERIPSAQAYIQRIDLIAADAASGVAPTRPVARLPPSPSTSPPTLPVRQPPRPGRLRLVIAAVAAVSVALLAVIAGAGGDGTVPPTPSPPVAPATPPAVSAAAERRIPELAEVHDLVRSDRRDAAIQQLHMLRRRHPDEAYLAVLQGALYLDKFYCRDGFKAYRAAFAIDPDTRSDPAVIRSSVRALRSRGNHRRAAEFLVHEIGPPAIPYLQQAARSDSKTLSERAERVLARLARDAD